MRGDSLHRAEASNRSRRALLSISGIYASLCWSLWRYFCGYLGVILLAKKIYIWINRNLLSLRKKIEFKGDRTILPERKRDEPSESED